MISFNGDVRLLKMPPIINPLREDEAPPVPVQPAGKGQAAAMQQLNVNPSQQNLDDKLNLKLDLDSIPTQNLDIN